MTYEEWDTNMQLAMAAMRTLIEDKTDQQLTRKERDQFKAHARKAFQDSFDFLTGEEAKHHLSEDTRMQLIGRGHALLAELETLP